MADKTVKVKYTAEMNEMLSSIGKMGEAYHKSVGTATQESEKLSMSAAEIRMKIQELGSEIDGLKDVSAIRQKQAEMQQYESALDAVLGKTKQMPEATGGIFEGSFLGSFSGNIAAKGFEMAATAVGSIGEAMIGGNEEMERYTLQFGTLMGSTEAAKQRLEELAKFGAATPFELPEIAAAEKVLLGFGLTGQKVIDMTGKNAEEFRTIVGDIAAGTGASFEEIALNMGKLSSGATGEAISRFQEMGIATREQLTAMGVEFSKSGELLSPLPVAMQAITKLTEEKFGGGMAALSASFGGLTSTLSDNLAEIGRTIGKPFFDMMKSGVGAAVEFLSSPAVTGAVSGLATAIASITGFMASNADVVMYLTGVYGAWYLLMNLAAIKVKIAAAAHAVFTAVEAAQTFVTGGNIAAHTALIAVMSAHGIQAKAAAAWTAILTTVQAVWGTVTGAATVAMAALNVVMAANPISLIVIAIAALIGGLILAYNKITVFRAVVNAVWATMKAYFNFLMNMGKLVMDILIGIFTLDFDRAAYAISKTGEVVTNGMKDMAVAGTNAYNEEMEKGREQNEKGQKESLDRQADAEVKAAQDRAKKASEAYMKQWGSENVLKEIGEKQDKIIAGVRTNFSKAGIEQARQEYAELEAEGKGIEAKLDYIQGKNGKKKKADDVGSRIRQLEIDLIDDESERLMEQYLLDVDLTNKKIKNAEERALAIDKIEKKFNRDSEAILNKRADAEAQAGIDAIKDKTAQMEAQYAFNRALANRDITDEEEKKFRLAELERKYNSDKEALEKSTAERINQLRTDLIDDSIEKLMEQYRAEVGIAKKNIANEEEKQLKLKQLEKKYGKDISKERKERANKEKEAYEKSRQAFRDDYAAPVAQASTDLILSLTDDKMTAMEREQQFWNSMKNIALDVTGQILEKVIADGLMMLAESAGLVAAQAPIAAAAGATWAGPAALASTATFGGAAVAGAAGLSSTFALAQLMAVPKFLEKGGILNKPTFVAGEAGAEVVGSLTDLIAVFRAAIYGPQQRRTKILNRTQPRVNIGIGNKMFGRGSRSAQISQTSGAF